MGIGEKLVKVLLHRQDRQRKRQPGPNGEFFRAGGNALLHDLPIETGELVIDAGGFRGEWTAEILIRYGCRSRVYEPIPEFALACRERFGKNKLVSVVTAALGGADGNIRIGKNDDGSSEFGSDASSSVAVQMLDVARELTDAGENIACMKINIEGGEYALLERLIEKNLISNIRCLLIQFHTRPNDWQKRYAEINRHLSNTHELSWQYDMVWEKWVLI